MRSRMNIWQDGNTHSWEAKTAGKRSQVLFMNVLPVACWQVDIQSDEIGNSSSLVIICRLRSYASGRRAVDPMKRPKPLAGLVETFILSNDGRID